MYGSRRFTFPQWVWILTAWLAFALFDATKTVQNMRAEGMHHNWSLLFIIEALSWLPWAAATALVVSLGHLLARIRRPVVTWIARIGAGLLIGLASALWYTLLVMTFRPFDAPSSSALLPYCLTTFYNTLPSTAVFYACILMVQHILETKDRLTSQKAEMAQLSEQLAHAQLSALRRQIEPHFLFNALNAVAGLVREGRGEAGISMIVRLSDFLRRTLSGSTEHEVPLAQEVEFTEQYLTIQQARFADRLRLDIDIPVQLESALVPNLILQPIVENAVNHGIAKQKDGGMVRIAASTVGGSLFLNVANDGPLLARDWNDGERGIGLSNVQTRLTTLYGDASSFDMRNRSSGGVEVSIAIPLRIGSQLRGAFS